MGFAGPQNSLVAIAAKVLNVEVTNLYAELQKGKSIADVAKEKNISTDKIVDEFLAQRVAWMQSVMSARGITQAQIDAMAALMKTHVTQQLTAKYTTGGFGFGMGPNWNYGTQPFGQYPSRMGGGMMGGWR